MICAGGLRRRQKGQVSAHLISWTSSIQLSDCKVRGSATQSPTLRAVVSASMRETSVGVSLERAVFRLRPNFCRSNPLAVLNARKSNLRPWSSLCSTRCMRTALPAGAPPSLSISGGVSCRLRLVMTSVDLSALQGSVSVLSKSTFEGNVASRCSWCLASKKR